MTVVSAIRTSSIYNGGRAIFSRRVFLRIVAGAGVCGLSLILAGKTVLHNDPAAENNQTIKDFLDILIPEDGSPSASQLGIDKIVIDEINRNKDLLELTGKFFVWLEAASKKAFGTGRFSRLNDSQRQQIVAEAAESAEGTVPRTFFYVILRGAFYHYYANPLSWKYLSYNGPPQPVGFPDQAEPPRLS
ncbi:MAG: gluconate 2-dehydrogenase subunit 3 family protein [Nitrospirae bacterium]|nr:gluconate 2-dehydrogenase subunit 3 family protein [Nitrospirota bacterium]